MRRLSFILAAIASIALMGCSPAIDATQFNAAEWEKQIKNANLSEKEFTRLYAQKAAAEIKGARVKIVAERELKLTLPDRTELTAYLDNAWAEAAKHPTNRPEIVSRYLTALKAAEAGAAEKADLLDTNSIVAVIRDQRFVAQFDKLGVKATEKIISETLVADFKVLYALDQEGGIRYLTERDRTTLNVSLPELRKLAMANLKRLLPEVNRHGTGPVFMIVADGNYEGSLLLADKLWEDQAQTVEGELVAAVPARDTLIVTGSKSKNGIATLRQIVARVEKEGSHLITGTLIVRRNGRWEEYVE
jgi:uncharacterized protein YtpQ (UPF0354 family)